MTNTVTVSIFLTIPSGAGCFFSINKIYWKFKDTETVSIHQVSDFTQRKPFGRIVTAVFNIKPYNFRDLGRFQGWLWRRCDPPPPWKQQNKILDGFRLHLAVASIAFRWTHILPTDGKGMCDLLNHLQTGYTNLPERYRSSTQKGIFFGNSSTFMTRTSLIFYWQPWRTIQQCFLDNVPFVHSDPNSIPCIASRTWI